MWERRKEKNKQRVMKKRKCFVCGEFRHIIYNCINRGVEGPTQVPSNKFDMLKSRIMQRGEGSGIEAVKNRKEILREERAKKRIEVKQIKIERKEKKDKFLREIMMKIRLKQKEEKEGIVVDTLLDSKVTELVMSKEFTRRHRFRRTKLERLIYVRNIDGMLNYVGPIVDTVEIEIYFRGHKKRISIDVIGG